MGRRVVRDVEEWYVWYIKTLGPVSLETINSKLNSFSHLKVWLNGRDVLKFRMDERKPLEQHISNTCGANSIRQYMIDIRKFYNTLVEYDFLRKSPFEGYKLPKGQEPDVQEYEFSEVIPALLAACRDERDTLIVQLGVLSGLRRTELAALTWDNISFQNGEIRVFGKGEKFRDVAISDELIEILKRNQNGSRHVIKNYGTGEGLNPRYLYLVIKRIAERAGYPRFATHDLRRLHAQEYVVQTGDIEALQKQLGHRDVKTTLRYTKSTKKRRRKNAEKIKLPTRN